MDSIQKWYSPHMVQQKEKPRLQQGMNWNDRFHGKQFVFECKKWMRGRKRREKKNRLTHMHWAHNKATKKMKLKEKWRKKNKWSSHELILRFCTFHIHYWIKLYTTIFATYRTKNNKMLLRRFHFFCSTAHMCRLLREEMLCGRHRDRWKWMTRSCHTFLTIAEVKMHMFAARNPLPSVS